MANHPSRYGQLRYGVGRYGGYGLFITRRPQAVSVPGGAGIRATVGGRAAVVRIGGGPIRVIIGEGQG